MRVFFFGVFDDSFSFDVGIFWLFRLFFFSLFSPFYLSYKNVFKRFIYNNVKGWLCQKKITYWKEFVINAVSLCVSSIKIGFLNAFIRIFICQSLPESSVVFNQTENETDFEGERTSSLLWRVTCSIQAEKIIKRFALPPQGRAVNSNLKIFHVLE